MSMPSSVLVAIVSRAWAGICGLSATLSLKPVDQVEDQDRADEGGAQRGPEVEGRPLQAPGLAGLGRVGRRHDHVAELGGQQTPSGTDQDHGDLEPRVVEIHV